MRTPTPLAPLYQWHRDALAGKKPMITNEPQVGWFTCRLARVRAPGTVVPIVPARIWLHQEIENGELTGPEILRCEVAGKERDPVDEWIWLAASPITEVEFNYRVADAAWARTHAMDSPEANPSVPVSSRTIPPLF